MKLLDQIVKDMLLQHEGGEKFFDNLDLSIQKEPIINDLLELIKEKNIIVSGKFGMFFSNYIKDRVKDVNLVLVNGGLRASNKITDLSYMDDRIHNKEFVFVDDSYYSGKTKSVIQEELHRFNAKIVKTYVVYDGSKTKDVDIISLYRYYDNIQNNKMKRRIIYNGEN